MKKQMNVNENLLQLALKERQDTNILNYHLTQLLFERSPSKAALRESHVIVPERTHWRHTLNKSVLARMKKRYLKKM